MPVPAARVALAQLENRKKALQLARIGPRQEDIAQAEAQLKAPAAELALLNHQLSLAELKAPIDAIVRSRLLEPGDMASPRTPGLCTGDHRPEMGARLHNRSRSGAIKPGMSASVTTDSHPDQPIPGTSRLYFLCGRIHA